MDEIQTPVHAFRSVDERCCEKCRNLATMPSSLWDIMIAKNSREKNIVPHHASVAELEKSAMNGCHLCNLFWAAFTDDTGISDLPKNTALIFKFYYDGVIRQMKDLNQDQCRIDIVYAQKHESQRDEGSHWIGATLILERHGKYPSIALSMSISLTFLNGN